MDQPTHPTNRADDALLPAAPVTTFAPPATIRLVDILVYTASIGLFSAATATRVTDTDHSSLRPLTALELIVVVALLFAAHALAFRVILGSTDICVRISLTGSTVCLVGLAGATLIYWIPLLNALWAPLVLIVEAHVLGRVSRHDASDLGGACLLSYMIVGASLLLLIGIGLLLW